MTATDLQAYGGAVLALPTAASYAGAVGYLPSILADGTGSRVDLGTLPALTGGTSHDRYNTYIVYIQATHGGLIDLSNAATMSQQVMVQASGQDEVENGSLRSTCRP